MTQDQPEPTYGQSPTPPPAPPAPEVPGVPPVPPSAPGYGPPAGTVGYGAPGASSMSPSDERLWGLLAHLSWIAGSIVAIAPLGPLVVFLVFKDRSPFVRRHSVEALNFWITVYIGLAISLVLMLVVVGFVTFAVISIGALVLSILAALAANRGEDYRYPFTLRLIT